MSRLIVLVTLSLVLGLVRAAAAAPLDHLVCRTVTDASEAEATVAIDTLPFGTDAGCVVRSKAREICAPATAAVLEGAADDADRGDDLTVERTCYAIECPERELGAVGVTDRYGTRPLRVLGARKVCVPAEPSEQP